MKINLLIGIILSLSIIFSNCTNITPPDAHGPVPTENQMSWQEMEYYAFIHFSLNTYTDQSWGFGNEDVNLFNPDSLDTRQWARICKEAGMKGIIITAKHHCGFCLWPTETTEYSVNNAPWKDGKGDVLREMADACKEYGLKLGIYVSPWDRNHPDYGKPEYITVFRNQIKEVLTNYGEVFEIWFDGAHGGTGYYGGAYGERNVDRTTYYDWQPTYKMIRKLQPGIVIWNDGGDRADLRWVGTEEGYVSETNWSLLNATGDVPWGMLHYGVENGDSWVPAEVNTSIRPEWFYHPAEDDKVKSVPYLMETYYNSIGHNGTLLLNFPIMPNGLIHSTDEEMVLGFAQAVKESFSVNLAEKAKTEASNVRGNSKKFNASKAVDGNTETYWATDDSVTTASMTIDLGKPSLINRFMAQEYIRLGQRVKSFTVEAFTEGDWKEISRGTTIGYKRIVRFSSVNASKVRFTISDSKACPLISNIGIYNAPVFLNAPSIARNQNGEVSISTNDIGPIFYYTLDGSEPTTESKVYTAPFIADGKVEVKAIATEPATGKSSPVGSEKFDISKKDWKVVGIDDAEVSKIFDGNPSTTWHKRGEKVMPFDLVIDFGNTHNLSGFKYLPDQNKWSSGIIKNYQFYVSTDNVKWNLVREGEFSNIKNNPVWQIKNFNPVNARYIKFRALKNTWGDQIAGFAEVKLITE
ncbi:MAG TPA: alpha-L-fucosidase [Prolixibacteraceae bacterium]|nr:alpha-L-fucosidase [Prolixibacteraceae bacterium]